MAVNKVVYGGETLVDLTGDTVTPETMLVGATAHNRSGEQIAGAVDLSTKADKADLTAHIDNTSNPHGVTAEQIGALSLSGGTMTGALYGTDLGSDAARFQRFFGREYYFENVNPNVSSPYKFGMYQWDNKFTFVTRNAANTHLADAWQIDGSTAVTNFSQRPTVTGHPVATQNEVPSKTENWTFTLEDGTTVTKAVYVK